jgi:hypothetical protein
MQGTNSLRRIFAWLALVISSTGLLVVLYTSLVLCVPPGTGVQLSNLGGVPAALALVGFAVLCILIGTLRPENRIGWLCGVISIGGAIAIALGNFNSSLCFPAQDRYRPN